MRVCFAKVFCEGHGLHGLTRILLPRLPDCVKQTGITRIIFCFAKSFLGKATNYTNEHELYLPIYKKNLQ